MQKVLISGGSGLIGSSLTTLLQKKGHEVAWLSRSNKAPKGVTVFKWDVNAGTLDSNAIAWADVLVHLAGEGIAEKRWSNARKNEIIDSRTKSAAMLLAAMQLHPGKIHTVIAASAIGFYGETNSVAVKEDAVPGIGFLSESVKLWEAATAKFAETGARLVTVRIGVVLSLKGGALKEIVQTAGIRVLPIMGNGKQLYSWIHIDDVVKILTFSIENPLSGTYNAVAPNPVNQKTIVAQYKNAMRKWYLLMPVPAFGLRLALGEMADAVLFNQYISASKIQAAGFEFQFPTIEAALTDLVSAK